MDVILTEDIRKLGKTGDVVSVKDGFARNHLLPKKLACPATTVNLRRIETRRAKMQQEDEQRKQDAEALAERIGKASCTVTVEVNDLEKMYGSVSEADIAKALELEGFKIDKNDIELEKPIDELGIFDVGVKLHPDVKARFRLWVAKK